MPIIIDEPISGALVSSSGFLVRGWLWLESAHDNIAAIEAWVEQTLVGEAHRLESRPDVNAALNLPPDICTGFRMIARLHRCVEAEPVALNFRARFRDGTTSAELAQVPVIAGRDPLDALRSELGASACGLEIGAHAQAVPGVSPFYTDVVAEFAGSAGRADFLADASALPLADATLDYLCSSHVLEHLADPLGALHEWHRVLRPGGVLYLIVPDKRFTFDAPRPVTPVTHLLRDFLHATTAAESAEHIDEFVFQTDWRKLHPEWPAEEQPGRQEAAARHYRECIRAGEAIDIHFHTFTPRALRDLLQAAGFFDGGAARFELAAEAERFPAERGDGIGFLLRKAAESQPREQRETFRLPHTNPAVPALPLVCPVTLSPLRREKGAPDNASALVSADGNFRYAMAGTRPVLLPPPGVRPRRRWSTRFTRMKVYLAGRLRLARDGGGNR
jgi:SAM-dependent methyltransferase